MCKLSSISVACFKYNVNLWFLRTILKFVRSGFSLQMHTQILIGLHIALTRYLCRLKMCKGCSEEHTKIKRVMFTVAHYVVGRENYQIISSLV